VYVDTHLMCAGLDWIGLDVGLYYYYIING